MQMTILSGFFSALLLLSATIAAQDAAGQDEVNPDKGTQRHFLVRDRTGLPIADAVIAESFAIGSSTKNANAAAESLPIAIMDQINKTFQPFVLDIAAGQQVSFPNRDNIRHHVYSFSPAKVFELRLYSGVPEAPLTFASPGIVVLGCNIHDSMVGYIHVAPSVHHGKTDSAGRVSLSLPQEATEISLWHPSFSLDGQKQMLFQLNELPGERGDAKDYRVIIIDALKSPKVTGGTTEKYEFKSTSKFKKSP